MPRLARLITAFTKQEIDTIFKSVTKQVKKAGLDIRLAPTTAHLSRVLIIIPKKFGTAPQRNRLRRQIKAIFYEEKLYTKPYNLIIIASSQAQMLPFAVLKQVLLDSYNA